MTNKFKLLILDFDGTVGDSRRLITDTMLQTIDALGLETRTREQCARMIGLPLARCFTEMIPMTEEMGEKCAATYREFFKQNNRPGAVTLFPGVADTLQRLHNRHIHLSFASSRSHAS
ncbi:HAD family hydrolase, partial [Segatella buccae]